MHVLDLWEDPGFRDQGDMGPFKAPVYRSPASFCTGRDGTWRASVPCPLCFCDLQGARIHSILFPFDFLQEKNSLSVYSFRIYCLFLNLLFSFYSFVFHFVSKRFFTVRNSFSL